MSRASFPGYSPVLKSIRPCAESHTAISHVGAGGERLLPSIQENSVLGKERERARKIFALFNLALLASHWSFQKFLP